MPTTGTRKKTRPGSKVVVQRAAAGAPATALLGRFARAAAAARSIISLRIVGARESKNLNKKYRKKSSPTNVLSFPYGAGSGDVVLCHPVISKESRQQGKSLRAHYAHLVVHGVLHLRGYDHRTRRQAARMEGRETGILRRLGFADPYRG
jgi:probable rRNA maturation factor